MSKRIIVIDDDMDICFLLRRFLSKNGFDVAIAHTGKEGLELLNSFTPDLVLTDFKLGDMNGVTILKHIKEKFYSVPVLIITGYSDIKIAIEVMKQGAYDYITKPLLPDEILHTINKALNEPLVGKQADNEEIKPTKSKTKITRPNFLKGESLESTHLYKQVDLVAPTNYSVLIYGESGSGKEAIAQEIHNKSERASQPFVAMDCGAISKDLASSELFGHEKGAFTGALTQKIGHFEMANGGTIFLDEIANLPYDVQASLLRVVQERKFRRIGGSKEISVDVRIIVASNERLLDAARKGKFREDLYYRFNEFSIEVPPLRNRKDDIMAFATYFLDKTNSELNKNVKGFKQEVIQIFKEYPWPGNLRELRNVIKRATLLSEGNEIDAITLPFEMINFKKLLQFEKTPLADLDFEPTQDEKIRVDFAISDIQPIGQSKEKLKSAALMAEYEMILETLKKVNFNKSKAAKLLGIDRKTLYNKMNSIQTKE